MQANDDNENEDGAVEGLVDLCTANPYQGGPIHREEQFRNSNLVNTGTFDKSLLWEPFETSKAAYATLELESFVNKKVNGIYQLENSGIQCRIVCRGDKGRVKWNKVLKKYEPIERRFSLINSSLLYSTRPSYRTTPNYPTKTTAHVPLSLFIALRLF